MEDKNFQTIYVHDKHEIRDDGEIVQVPSLNVYGDIQNREALAEAVSKEVDLDSLADAVGKDIGDVLIDGDEIKELNLYDWVVREHGYSED